MGFMSGVWRMLGADDEVDSQQQIVDYPAPVARAPRLAVEVEEAADTPSPQNSTICVVRPELNSAGETLYSMKEYAAHLLTGNTVLLDISVIAAIDDPHAKRVVDYLTGVVEAVGGAVSEITTNIFIFTPAHVTLAGDPVNPVEVN